MGKVSAADSELFALNTATFSRCKSVGDPVDTVELQEEYEAQEEQEESATKDIHSNSSFPY